MALVPPLPFHSSGGTYKHALPVPRMCVGSEVGLVLTHAGSHMALLAHGLAELTVPQASIPPTGEHPPRASTCNCCSFLAPPWLPREVECAHKGCSPQRA